MDYLTRDRISLELVGNIGQFSRGNVSGKSSIHGTTFTPLGQYEIGDLGQIYLGLKEYPLKGSKEEDWNSELAFDLAILQRLSQSSLAGEIPRMYGHLRNEHGTHLGVLCEDFSEGGRHRAYDIVEERHYPTELRDIFELDLSDDEVRTIGFL